MRFQHVVLSLVGLMGLAGCQTGSITAVNMNPDAHEPEGIPYYLPKPYLIITKNIRYIPTPTVGLTQTVAIPQNSSISNQSPTSGGTNANGGNGKSANGGAGGNGTGGSGSGAGGSGGGSAGGGSGGAGSGSGSTATNTAQSTTAGNQASTSSDSSTNSDNNQGKSGSEQSAASAYGSQVLGPASIAVVPPASISDGLVPQEFYTYQIVYLPDLTQKYGLQIKGGSGEMRATENLVNGWMHTGTGPLLIADSTTAQDVTASGQAIADVSQAVGQVALSAFGIPTLPTGGASQNSGGGAAKNTAAAIPTASNNNVTPIPNYAQIYVFELQLSADKKTTQWVPVAGLPSFSREWIELERAATPAPSDNGTGTQNQANMSADEAAVAQSISSSLNKDWDFSSGSVVVEIKSPQMAITAKAKPKNGGTAADLKSAVIAAAKAYPQFDKLNVGANQVTAQVNVQQ